MPTVHPFEILKGAGLLAFLYALYAFIAFGIFSRETGGFVILTTWAAATVILWLLLWRFGFITKQTVLFFVLSVVFLVIMYFVPIRDNVPEEAQALNEQIAEEHEDRMMYARQLFFTLQERWTTPVRQYLLEPHKAFFIKDFQYFWEEEGEYVDSNTQSQMYRILLLESNRFSEDEVTIERKDCVHSPHTIVAIRLEDETVYADLWAADHFEEYEFGMFTDVMCDELFGEPHES
jgi:hypothetical protein